MSSVIRNSFYRDRSSRLRQTIPPPVAYKNEKNTTNATPPSGFREYLESKTKTSVKFLYGCCSPVFNNKTHRYIVCFEKGSKKKLKKSVDKRNHSHKSSPLRNVVNMEDLEKDEKRKNNRIKGFDCQLDVKKSQSESTDWLSNKDNAELWEGFFILPDHKGKRQKQQEQKFADDNEFYKFILYQQTIFSNILTAHHTKNNYEKNSISKDNRNSSNNNIISRQYERDFTISEEAAAIKILKFHRRTPKFRNSFAMCSRTPAEAAKRFEAHFRSCMPRMAEGYKSVQIAKFTILQILRQVYADEDQYQKHIKFFNEYYDNVFGQKEGEAQVKVKENLHDVESFFETSEPKVENNNGWLVVDENIEEERNREKKVLDERKDNLLNACFAFQSNHYIQRKVTSQALRKFLPYYLLYRLEGGKYAAKVIKEFK